MGEQANPIQHEQRAPCNGRPATLPAGRWIARAPRVPDLDHRGTLPVRRSCNTPAGLVGACQFDRDDEEPRDRGDVEEAFEEPDDALQSGASERDQGSNRPAGHHPRERGEPTLDACHAGLCWSVEPSLDAATMIAAKITIAKIMWMVPCAV